MTKKIKQQSEDEFLKEALARAERYGKYLRENPPKLIEIEIPPCGVCGRVIYCGADTLCGEVDCPSKTKGADNG